MIKEVARILLVGIFLILSAGKGLADDFFVIQQMDYIKNNSKSPRSFYRPKEGYDKQGKWMFERIYLPVIYVRVSTQGDMFAKDLYYKVYFYDENNKQLTVVTNPIAAKSGQSNVPLPPKLFKKKEIVELVFAAPENVIKQNKWKALVVFGDQKSAAAKMYPANETPGFVSFDEKKMVENNEPYIERKEAIEPLIEYPVKTKNAQQPIITLFVRPPIGMTDAKEAKGVMAMCLLASDISEMRRKLQGLDSATDLKGVFQYAEQNKLILICWGSKKLWNSKKNWDDLDKDEAKRIDESFSLSADAWARGIGELNQKYGIPKRNFLLWGMSGAAQYACRLALKKPEYFLAVNIHIPSSFDQPTAEANRVLWCLTTGEKESGHARSLQFYNRCRVLGYPITYKAVMGLGHAWSQKSELIGLRFFDYALGVQQQRDELELQLADPLNALNLETLINPWPEEFRNPPFVGDMVNQEMYPQEQKEMVPKGFRVPLPTKEIAETWREKR
jgi:hypothetical protein